MKYSSFFLFLTLIITACSNHKDLKIGDWDGYLKLNDSINLPFSFKIEKNTANYELTIINGEEKTPLIFDFDDSIKSDSLVYSFKAYNTYLIFSIDKENKISGYWVNNDRKNNSRIPFYANSKKDTTISYLTDKNISGKWEVRFSYNDSIAAYPAIGLFEQHENNLVSGTFLTETGDYRFLTGNISEKELILSCFDGSHAFLFKSTYEQDSLKGLFYSGSHWKTNWYGVKNDSFELADPYKLTYLESEEKIRFSKPDLAKNNFSFPNDTLNGKVIILQLFGSWCPNCMDETVFFKTLYEDYNNSGLEIIALGYEMPEELDKKIARLKNYKSKFDINYTLLVGGKANKKEASADFPMLNNISSFPTSIFINRAGEVVKIHTGFNGPGTGKIYDAYVEETKVLVEKLLNE